MKRIFFYRVLHIIRPLPSVADDRISFSFVVVCIFICIKHAHAQIKIRIKDKYFTNHNTSVKR